MSAADRRADLIRAAIEVFSRLGFEGATTEAIAQEAGVSEALIFRHFATKDDLYAAILDEKANTAGVAGWMEELLAHAERGEDEAVFTSIASKIVEAYQTDPQFHRLMFYSALEGHAAAKVMQQQRNMPIYEVVREYVARRQREGAFREGDPGAMVYALVALPTYYSIVKRLFGLDLLTISDKEAVDQFVRFLLQGIKSGSPKEEI